MSPEKDQTFAVGESGFEVLDDLPEIPERILLAAMSLFARKGYAGTTVREIVQEAEVTNPMLYYYFGNKEGLFLQLMELLTTSFRNEILEIAESDASFSKKLEDIARKHFEGMRERPLVLDFIYSVLFGPTEGRPEYDIVGNHMVVLNAITEVFEDAIDSGVFEPRHEEPTVFYAETFVGLINHTMMRALKQYEMLTDPRARQALLDNEVDDQAAARAVEFFVEGAGTVREGEDR